MRTALADRVASLKRRSITPGLAVILVGDDAASLSYVTGKERACAQLGMYSQEHRLETRTSQRELLDLISRLNEDRKIHGILVQLPLPGQIDPDTVIAHIVPEKDVDGFHPVNLGKILLEQPGFIPCTPHGIIKLLEANEIPIAGSHTVIVGRSRIVGKPLANLLLRRGPSGNATVTVCHTGTRNLSEFTRQADILIVATGRPEMIGAEMVRPGAVVIDVGVNRVADSSTSRGYRLVGDVAFEAVSKIASAITPVPKGVGPMTITMLMYNTVEAAERISQSTEEPGS